MKKNILLFACLFFSTILFAQGKMYLHKSDHMTLGASLSNIEEIYFSNKGDLINFRMGNTIVQYSMAEIDSISFTDNPDTVYINYNGSYVSVINPLAFEGVSVDVDGANVTVNATEDAQGVNYKLSGETSNGMFIINSEKKFYLFFNKINITNPNGPAINSQSKKKATVTLVDGTTNILTDGASYSDEIVNESGETEEQGAAFFSKGTIVFDGTGSLTINGKGSDQHALCSDDDIRIENGNISHYKQRYTCHYRIN